MKESTQRKNVVLADCPTGEIVNFLKGVNSLENYTFECISEVACGIRNGAISEIKRYSAYFKAAWHAFKMRRDLGIIIGWQQFYALIFCFYCKLFHVKKENTVLALNFTFKEKKGFIGKIYKLFMQWCICTGYLDYIHVPSKEYAEYISKEFNFSRECIIVTPFGVDDIYGLWKNCGAPNGYRKNGYAMTIGRSNRDFDFLIEAWKSIDFPLVLISDTYKPKVQLPENVTLITDVAGDRQYPYIANARFIIIPIEDGKICSGDTVLLTSLSFEKTTVVTSPSTLGEMYIENGVNGYLVEKKLKKFVAMINALISREESFPDLGKNARKSYLDNFSRYSMGKKVIEFIGEMQNV